MVYSYSTWNSNIENFHHLNLIWLIIFSFLVKSINSKQSTIAWCSLNKKLILSTIFFTFSYLKSFHAITDLGSHNLSSQYLLFLEKYFEVFFVISSLIFIISLSLSHLTYRFGFLLAKIANPGDLSLNFLYLIFF